MEDECYDNLDYYLTYRSDDENIGMFVFKHADKSYDTVVIRMDEAINALK